MNQVRLNAGIWRSRVLKFPDAEGLRPTADRVRQTLFNWLGQDMTGKVCLDLFAGTGALGFEALSRNARQVTMLELAKAPFQALLQNQRLLGAAQADIRQADALQFLAQNRQRYDVIFCDPPYHKQWLDKLLPLLSVHLAEDGVLYVEAEYALKSDPDWQVVKSGKAGQVFYHLLRPEQANITAQVMIDTP
ncbi:MULTISPECIES: 16S rRNA (guanine(966)-N(2))-methyltransferase RsmD [Methylophilus]|jgi:16S rRNA (guanine(966)-N(2))-methyltransferase RsmD|uniref:16S rRNA (guanine(966)-N(2))-methyltransferase RsmD n=1 Tax=Methylophilus TaxID=16 RepID=UPI000D45AF7B|nr:MULTISPECIES: 16S rRNA (guanine(966)-N(2))-methyltransferase RsmD [Methylophilus]PPD13132.1 MAG: 16S rRNA (guanine(966)-N(2))-methyltransferase RsmD [Methylophilus sp.]